MRKIHLKSILCSLIILCVPGFSKLSEAQDPVFSQYGSAPLQINPAFAGINESTTIGLNYRNQWPSISQAYVTYALYYDQYFSRIKSGIGFQILTDNAGQGLYRTTKATFMYAYRLRLSERWFVKGGFEGGLINTQVGWDKLTFPDQIDPIYGSTSPGGLPYPTAELPPDEFSRLNLTVSLGGLIYNDIFYIGFSAKHINTPFVNFFETNEIEGVRLPARITLHGGAQIPLDGARARSRVFVSPSIMLLKQGNVGQINAGAHFQLDKLILGSYFRQTFRNPDALIFMAGMKVDMFRIVYSFDATISKLTLGSGGAHEVGILVNFNNRKGSKYADCLDFAR